MHSILIIGAACMYVVFMPPMTTAITLVAIAVLTFVAEKTARVLTGAAVTTGEALRSVGLAFLFLGSYFLVVNLAGGTRGHWGTVVDAGVAFGAPGMLALLLGFLVAYTAGFKIGMGIDALVAAVVALVTSICSVIMFVAARPYLSAP